jgi:hypothetical protein
MVVNTSATALTPDAGPGAAPESSLRLALTGGFSTPAKNVNTDQRPHTRLRAGIHKPKVYTDGTIHYGCLTQSMNLGV